MVSVLQSFSDVVHSVCNGWKESWKEYEMESAKFGAGLETIEDDTSKGC